MPVVKSAAHAASFTSKNVRCSIVAVICYESGMEHAYSSCWSHWSCSWPSTKMDASAVG